MIDKKVRFVEMMATLGAAFGVEVTEHMADAYWSALSDLPVEGLLTAGQRLLQESQYFPRPVNFREYAKPTTTSDANAAWEKVLKLATNSQNAVHPDPFAEIAVKRLGGWRALGQKNEDDLRTWTRKEFIGLYEDLAKGPQHKAIGQGEVNQDVQGLAADTAAAMVKI